MDMRNYVRQIEAHGEVIASVRKDPAGTAAEARTAGGRPRFGVLLALAALMAPASALRSVPAAELPVQPRLVACDQQPEIDLAKCTVGEDCPDSARTT